MQLNIVPSGLKAQVAKESNEGLIVTGDMFIAGTTTEMEIEMTMTPSNDKFYMTGVIDFTH